MKTKSSVQGATDNAALAASVAELAGNNSTRIQDEVYGIAAANGFINGQNGVTVTLNNPPDASSKYAGNTSAYQVIITKKPTLFFGALLGSAPTIAAQATAMASGSTTTTTTSTITHATCLLALDPSAGPALNVSGSGLVNLPNCDADANSSSSKALEVQGGSASLKAQDSYIVGNYSTSGGATFTVSGTLQTDATAIVDPYASRTAPTVGSCGSNPTSSSGGGYNGNYNSPSTPTTVYPGVYCGTVTAGGPLTLSPGVYIVEGDFKVQGGSSGDPVLSGGVCSSPTGKPYVNATNATIYITGGNYDMADSSCLSITAPTTGNTAGMAIWIDKSVKAGNQQSFTGGSNVAITGAIYAPTQQVVYSGSSSAASSCTQIVADTIEFTGAANLQHNCGGVGISDPTTTTTTTTTTPNNTGLVE